MEQPFINFLSWLIADPQRIERYQDPGEMPAVVQAWETENNATLPEDVQKILRENDLRGATEVIKRETGSDQVMFFVIRFVR